MSVCRPIVGLLALIVLLFSSACSRDGKTVTPDETTDPVYQQAKDLLKQGRNGEALTAFLKVIERRGEAGAPESHLEAGNLYLHWSHDPVEAYHHFGRYLELHPAGAKSDIVRGQRDAAKREIARTLLAPSPEQMVGVGNDEVQQLRRQIRDLQAEIQTLRGSGAVPAMRAPPMIALPEDATDLSAAPTVPVNVEPTARQAPAPAPASSPFMRPSSPAPQTAVPDRTTAGPARPTAPTRPGVAAPPPAGRTHTVTSSEKSLWGIARRYYGTVNNARVQALFEANRDVMRDPNDLRPGMVLRIP